jgi:deoxyribonuclease-4
MRLLSTLSVLLDKAHAAGSPLVQCFFISQGGNTYVSFPPEEISLCLAKRDLFQQLYVHASYWVNLAGRYNNGWRPFHRELELAKQLGFTHMVIHPGSASGCPSKEEGIEYLARALNKALVDEKDIIIVLENTAHANKTVGGNIQDFKKLLELLDKPEKVAFCLDSAHAFSYGYDLSTPGGVESFLEEVDQSIGAEKVVALHLNDSAESLGSRIDKHEIPGEGKIGAENLKLFMNHPKFLHTSVILELPVVSDAREREILQEVQGWDCSHEFLKKV